MKFLRFTELGKLISAVQMQATFSVTFVKHTVNASASARYLCALEILDTLQFRSNDLQSASDEDDRMKVPRETHTGQIQVVTVRIHRASLINGKSQCESLINAQRVSYCSSPL